MSATDQVENTEQSAAKTSDKEFNFRRLEKVLEQTRVEKDRIAADNARIAAELEEVKRAVQQKSSEDDAYTEPYVDEQRLEKKLGRFEEKIGKKNQADIQSAVHRALQEKEKKDFLDRNPDFYSTIQDHADKLHQVSPQLAESILKMPDEFERYRLVYNNIKALGIDKPPQKTPNIQEKIDANRRNHYYVPGGVASPPYDKQGDFSPSGQKTAYEQMQKLKAQMRL